jgi:hypothetical protein
MARPLALPIPQTNVFMLQAFLAFNRDAGPSIARGYGQAQRNADDNQNRTLTIYGMIDATNRNTYGSSSVAPSGSYGPTTDTNAYDMKVYADCNGDTTFGTVANAPTAGVNTMDTYDVPNIVNEGSSDGIFIQIAFTAGKQQVNRLSLFVQEGDSAGFWTILGYQDFDCSVGMFAGMFTLLASISRSWVQSNGKYKFQLTSEKSDGTGQTVHKTWEIAQP